MAVPWEAMDLAEWLSASKGHMERHSKVLHPEDSRQFVVAASDGPEPFMTGPLSRPVYRVLRHEVWFLQMEGEATLHVLDGSVFRDLHLRAGYCYLHPAGSPLAVSRPAAHGAGVGITVERRPYPGEVDKLVWYCGTCLAPVSEASCDKNADASSVAAAHESSAQQPPCPHCGATDAPLAQGSERAYPRDGSVLRAGAPQGPVRDRETHADPFSLFDWIATHEPTLRPPVSNKMVAGRGSQFQVMIVGGPNQRTDYHLNQGEEWFYQIKGNMVLKVVTEGGTKFQDVHIRQGQCFLLPGNTPHSPQRPEAGSVGLVIEHWRPEGTVDSLRWYCQNPECRQQVYGESFYCYNLGVQLVPVIQKYYASDDLRTCAACGKVDKPPVAK